MMPCEKVPSRPSGLPTAYTVSPMLTESSAANGNGMALAPDIFSSARSCASSTAETPAMSSFAFCPTRLT